MFVKIFSSAVRRVVWKQPIVKPKLVIIAVFLLALILRTYNLPELAQFRYDEARDAFAEKSLLLGRPTLLGPESLIGQKTIYFGPLHFYLMAPALLISHFDPLGPYFWTAILGALTVVVIYLTTESLVAALFYAVFPLAVIYNRWAWNPNTIPLFVALALSFLRKKSYLLFGLCLGLATQLHWSVLLILIVLYKQLKPATILGILLGLSPIIIFDLRHGFLYFHSLINLASFGTKGLASRTITWHYFLWLLPLLAAWLVRIPKKLTATLILVSLGTTIFWLTTQTLDESGNLATIRLISNMIASDQEKNLLNFNVAALVGGDTRATSYRYFLDLAGVQPLSIAQYDVADHLYVVSLGDGQSLLYSQTYEIASFRPRKFVELWHQGNESLFKLERS